MAIRELEAPLDFLRDCGYSPQASAFLLSEYYRMRAAGCSSEEAEHLFFTFYESGITDPRSLRGEIRAFHKRLCLRGFKPEQVAEEIERHYQKND